MCLNGIESVEENVTSPPPQRLFRCVKIKDYEKDIFTDSYFCDAVIVCSTE